MPELAGWLAGWLAASWLAGSLGGCAAGRGGCLGEGSLTGSLAGSCGNLSWPAGLPTGWPTGQPASCRPQVQPASKPPQAFGRQGSALDAVGASPHRGSQLASWQPASRQTQTSRSTQALELAGWISWLRQRRHPQQHLEAQERQEPELAGRFALRWPACLELAAGWLLMSLLPGLAGCVNAGSPNNTWGRRSVRSLSWQAGLLCAGLPALSLLPGRGSAGQLACLSAGG